jgi:hypothetical protein
MPPKQQETRSTAQQRQEQQNLATAIGRQVLHALGEPGNFLGVQVRSLWEGHFRANVLVGTDIPSARVAHSYFLVADGAGNILTSAPEMIRRYGAADLCQPVAKGER